MTARAQTPIRPTEVDLGVCRGQSFDIGGNRWAILLPGAGYTVTAPLLWFAREAALEGGWNVLAVSDTFNGTDDPLRWVEERAEAAIRHVDGATRPLLIAKSLTSLAAPLAARLGLSAVWLTPLINASGASVSQLVLDGLAAASAPCLLVGGTADPTWDAAIARSVPKAEVLEIGDADHRLQIPGDVAGSVDALHRIVSAVATFIAGPTAEDDQPAMRLTGMDHVQLAIPPNGEPTARAFYGGLLGLREVAKPDALASRGGCWFVGPGIHLHLGVAADFQPARKAHPAFSVANLSALRHRLMDAGVAVIEDESVASVRRFYASDPFGSRLEFIEHADRGLQCADEPRLRQTIRVDDSGDGVIIVVEGPSASGKTTWIQTHALDGVVAETAPVDPPEDVSATARFWAENGARRWEQALATEQRAGVAVCDTDPLKLHYSWSLWRIGAGSSQVFRSQVGAYREMMGDRRIGFADAYFVSIPAPEVLERRKSGDPVRRRRNFALHARLGEPLREWYAALEEVRPGSVRWGFPDEGVGQPVDSGRPRYDLEAYDALIRRVTGRRT